MYTIKEAAGILGMTKPGIRYRITALKIPLNKDAFGRITLSDDDLQWIRDGKKPESEVESGEKQEKEPEETGKNEKEPEGIAESAEAVALAVLREQCADQKREIEQLRAKLEEKDHRIDELTDRLTDALAKAQILHAQSVNLLPDAQTAQTEPEPEDEQESETRTRAGEDPNPRKRTLWERITGKRR